MSRSARFLALSIAIASAFALGETDARSSPGTEGSATAGGSGNAGSAASAQRSPELDAAVRALVNDRALKDAQSGEHNVLNPASTAKIYTAAAALAILHGSHW
jgi:D-alanyl-D-alanine carboxypeptidase